MVVSNQEDPHTNGLGTVALTTVGRGAKSKMSDMIWRPGWRESASRGIQAAAQRDTKDLTSVLNLDAGVFHVPLSWGATLVCSALAFLSTRSEANITMLTRFCGGIQRQWRQLSHRLPQCQTPWTR